MSEVMTPLFWTGLLTIIGINVILSGDNAVVIALAARSLPSHQQKRAIAWGAGAAVILRIGLALVAVELLHVPALKLLGGVLLLWIAVQLLVPESEDNLSVDASEHLGAAIKTIVIADLVMSTDNVVAVAAAAKGSMLLITLGLLISIPLVIFGAAMLMKLMEKWPVIVTMGAAVLGWTAVELALSDRLVASWLHAGPTVLQEIAPAIGAAFVVVVGKWLAARQSLPLPAELVAERAPELAGDL